MRISGLIVTRSAGASAIPLRGVAAAFREDQTDTDVPDDGRLGTLDVRFSPFNAWYRIDSFWEGSFMERTVPGAFKKTMREQGPAGIKVLFNHGGDLNIGDKVLGVPSRAEEEADSPVLEVPLLDTSYNRDLAPGLRAGAYGSSFMFEVLRDKWDHEPEPHDANPDGIPERTVQEVRLFEAGPVTWPANPAATASLRGSDPFLTHLAQRDPERFGTLERSFKAFRAAHDLRPYEAPVQPAPDSGRHTGDVTDDAGKREMYLRELRLAQMRARIKG